MVHDCCSIVCMTVLALFSVGDSSCICTMQFHKQSLSSFTLVQSRILIWSTMFGFRLFNYLPYSNSLDEWHFRYWWCLPQAISEFEMLCLGQYGRIRYRILLSIHTLFRQVNLLFSSVGKTYKAILLLFAPQQIKLLAFNSEFPNLGQETILNLILLIFFLALWSCTRHFIFNSFFVF